MKKTFVVAGLSLTMLAGPVLAAEFYIVQDSTTKKCRIVEQKPADTKTVTVVGDGKVFTTRSEAETSMKTVKVCTND